MIIRKLYKIESAHIVRNCYTKRCKFNVHGHSYKIEVFIQAVKHLDAADMVLDFNVLGDEVKSFIDSFDHSIMLWHKDSSEYKKDMMKHSQRVIIMSMNPSAESMALIFLYAISRILDATKLDNGEDNIVVSSVRVHETDTGYAEAFPEDIHTMLSPSDVTTFMEFSDAIRSEWKVDLREVINNPESYPLMKNAGIPSVSHA